MKFFFFMLTPIYCLNFCMNCKHFINEGKIRRGKCKKFPVVYDVNLIDGEKEDDDHYLCSTGRSFKHLCGPKGKYYEHIDSKNIDEFDFEQFIQFL